MARASCCCARVWRKVRSLRTANGRSNHALLIGILFSVLVTSACGGRSQLLAASSAASSTPASQSRGAVIGATNSAITTPTANAHRASLSWVASPTLVDGYEVYRSTQSGGPYSRITSSLIGVTWFTDTSVAAGQTYYYVVTAVAGSIESTYSNETIATIPSP